jgi:hypothetical protein
MPEVTDPTRQHLEESEQNCWLQWNAAAECNVMPRLAAFPNAILSRRPVQSNLAT